MEGPTMALRLFPCSSCDRHVRVEDPRCPFCGAVVLTPRPSVPWAWVGSLTRAAIFVGATMAASACGGEGESTEEVVVPPETIAQPYGAPPIEVPVEEPTDPEPSPEPPMRPMQPGDPATPPGLAPPPTPEEPPNPGEPSEEGAGGEGEEVAPPPPPLRRRRRRRHNPPMPPPPDHDVPVPLYGGPGL